MWHGKKSENRDAQMKTLSVLSILALFLVSAESLASGIDKRLGCTVQEFTNISVATNTMEGATVEKSAPSRAIKVRYAIDPRDGKLVETYAADSNLEQVTFYTRGYSAGGTQYIAEDGRSVVTYFGLTGKYYAIMKFTRIVHGDGGATTGWRADSYMNALMYCIAIE